MAADTETFSDPDPFTAVCVCVSLTSLPSVSSLHLPVCLFCVIYEKKLDLQLSRGELETPWDKNGRERSQSLILAPTRDPPPLVAAVR